MKEPALKFDEACFERRVLESNPDCMKVLDLSGNIIYMNRNGLQLFEVDDYNTIHNRPWALCWQSPFRETIEKGIAAALQGETVSLQAFCHTMKGKAKWWNVTVSPIYEFDGGPVCSLLAISRDVSEQMEFSKQQDENNFELNSIVQQTPAPTLVLRGEQLRIEYINPPMLGLLGRGTEVIGQRLIDLLPELEGQYVWEQVTNVYEKGIDFDQQEVPVAHNRGGKIQTYYYNLAYRPLRDGERIVGMIQVASDVTEQVLARQRLEASTASLQNTISQAPFAISIFRGKDFIIETANEAMFRFWGKKAADVINRPFFEALPEARLQGYEELMTTVLKIGKSFSATEWPVRVQREDSIETIYGDFTFEPLRDSEGRVTGIMTVANDITERVLARRRLEESEENLRSLVLHSPVGMCVLDAATLVAEIVNESFVSISGRKAEEIMGRPYWQVFTETKDSHADLLRQVVETGIPYSDREAELPINRDGQTERIYVDFVYMPMKDSEGHVTNVAIYVMENTSQVMARQKVEEQVTQRTTELADANKNLQIMNRELQRSNQNLEEFAHAASHDLKEPIRKIHFFTHQLKDQLHQRLNENELRSFVRIENATLRMGNLIDDLLLYSHVSQRPHETEPVDLNDQVARVLEDLELDIQEKKALIEVEQLPVVRGYRRQLQQLFQNLVSNALKYSRAGTQPHIHISAEKTIENAKEFYVIEVSDNGIGFEQQYAEKIFLMFSRLHGKSEYSGTGVGLSIVKKVVENHHGFIRVVSRVNEGACFRIYLPA